MSPLIILTIIAILYLKSKPKFRRYIQRDNHYLSHNWTAFVNALFISLVVCSHGLLLFQTSILDYKHEQFAAFAIFQFRQLMVTTFFFFSGYGIMYSLLHREGYVHKLLYPRFTQLSLNYLIAVIVYFGVHCILEQKIELLYLLHGTHSYSTLGNPTWFILITLFIYILTFCCFRITGQGKPMIAIGLLTAILIGSIFLIIRIKPAHWVNTMLCFPAGMFYCMKGDSIESLINKTRLPSIAWAILMMYIGHQLYHLNVQYLVSIYTQNAGGILFALGTTWLFGSFTWERSSGILTWIGGSSLFTIYMFHLLPMRILTRLDINTGNPYLVWFYVFAATCILVPTMNLLFKKANSLLIKK